MRKFFSYFYLLSLIWVNAKILLSKFKQTDIWLKNNSIPTNPKAHAFKNRLGLTVMAFDRTY